LEYPGKNEEHFLGEPIHCKGFVSSVAMQEKSLKEQGQVPMRYEKDQNCFHVLMIVF
jgi:hypothetical protein